jgi:hypothetical protein
MPQYDDVPETRQLPQSRTLATSTDPSRPFTSELPESLQQQLRIAAVLRSTTVKALLREAVEDWLKSHPSTHP